MLLRPLLVLAALILSTRAAGAQDGVTLYQGYSGTTTLLVDSAGAVVRSWPGTTDPALSVYLLPNGDLMRTRALTGSVAGAGGGLQRITWDGTVVWDFQLFGFALIPHHDIAVMPNGNVLMIAYEVVGATEAIAQGRNPATAGANFMPDKILEIQPTGPTTGAVVWEWRAWDHLIQDFDAGRPNFGVVADHPELIDLNYPVVSTSDWLHFNGIDYNAELDQIAISSPTMSEFWVIDHGTTTAEAAGHSGGARGVGGDLLYRWGNPEAYGRGTPADRRLYTNHDITWIAPGRPGAGNFLIFNNGNGRPAGTYSSVDELVPPLNASGSYDLTPGAAFGPATLAWTYFDPPDFWSNIMSGAERLPDGNTLICEATAGRLFEVTPAGTIVWDYTNPAPGLPWIFKARRYPDTITGVDFCFGDGGVASGCTACPCSNDAAPGTRAGCLNSSGSAARLVGSGLPSASLDTLRFEVQGAPASTFGVLVSADNRLPTSTANPCFGLDSGVTSATLDGLRCVGGNLRRHGSRATDAGGSIGAATPGWGPPNGPAGGLLAQGGFAIGQARNFQVFVRENVSVACLTGQNTTNAVGLVFLP